MPYALKYGGAHTMRDSGDAGWNPQNLNRQPVLFGASGLITDKKTHKEVSAEIKAGRNPQIGIDVVDMRSMITAPPGKILGVVDLKAIEPCCLNWFAEDEEMLALLRGGMDPYEAQARVTGRYDDPRPLEEADKLLRQFMKVEVLGLGYGAGPDKLIVIAKTLADLDLTFEQATEIVMRFRKRQFIPKLWRKLEKGMKDSAPGDFLMELPSGRVMRYRNIKDYGSLSAEIPRNGRLMRIKMWGGSLAENITQAASRDVFMDKCILIKNAGLPPILRVHDEAVGLLDENRAQEDLKTMQEIMAAPCSRMPGLPLAASAHLCVKYTKG